MSITMQGPWTVSVKSVEAGEPAQRFIISGAATGNGTYAGNTSTPPVHVTGANWVITVQIQKNAQWITEHDRITFPALSGGQYRFDIQANIPDNDPDWDDLVLTCSRPASPDAYLIYGSVSYYSANCIFNPCNRLYPTIESQAALRIALQQRQFHAALTKLYPDRVKQVPPVPPGPTPDPPPFVPLVLPLENGALPAKQADIVQLAADEKTQSKILRSITAPSTAKAIDFDSAALATIISRYFNRCETGPLPGIALRFLEYDRTYAELHGGAYTGTGNRQNLGVCTTDAAGNYVFLFTRSLIDNLAESLFDTAPGEDASVQVRPDVIAQVVATGPGYPSGYSYESAPYWNIGHLKRINICVPSSGAPIQTACQGGNAIQAIGNIFIGASNSFDAEGRITTNSTLLDTPHVQCAAWAGLLDLFACFTDHPDVTQYTIRYIRPGIGWTFFQEPYYHPEVARLNEPGYSGTLIGPFDRTLSGMPAKAYDNIENNNAFVLTHRTRKAWISSWMYPETHTTVFGARQYGSVTFEIQGYNAAGAAVSGAHDTITLYIDNNAPVLDISDVTMGAQHGDTCALFHVGGNASLPMEVTFRAVQPEGFMAAYQMSVRKGNAGGFGISGAGISGNSGGSCTYEGTLPAGDAAGYVTVEVTPNQPWLDPGQPFCTFAVHLSCSTRITNGYTAGASYGPVEYLLGIQA
jgi:hypothetical protein